LVPFCVPAGALPASNRPQACTLAFAGIAESIMSPLALAPPWPI